MCLRPNKIYNPTYKLGMNFNQRYEIEIPCGECCECKQQKKDEWYLRTYYQAKQTWDAGGYILFDTLTYNNENLPHVNRFIDFDSIEYKFTYVDGNPHAIVDRIKHSLKEENEEMYNFLNCSCFDSSDYRLFFVRLRRALSYRGYDSTKLKYFLTSEYGSTEGFTHRPHYHILFFVEDRSLDPLTLSMMINRCWKKGRTDGCMYYHKGWHDSDEYVLKKRVFGRGYNEDEVHMRQVCNYVSKYVMKDSEFQKVINDRLDRLFKWLYSNEDDYNYNEKAMNKFKKLVHECSQFHRQSKGFGEYGMQFIGDDEKNTGMMAIPDKNQIKKHIQIPMYYLLKLYYYPFVDRNGKKKQILTDEGIEWKVRRLDKNIERMEVRMKDWFSNIDLNYQFNDSFPYSREDFKKKIIDLLDGRTWCDYAKYLLVYKGRIMDDEVRSTHIPLDYDIIKRDIFLPIVDEDFDSDTVVYNYATKTTRRVWKCNFITNRSIGEFVDKKGQKCWTGSFSYLNVGYNAESEYSNGTIKEKVEENGNMFLTPFLFKKLYLYNEDSCKEFRNFDKIFELYSLFNVGISNVKQKAYDRKEELTKTFKDAGLLGFNKNI